MFGMRNSMNVRLAEFLTAAFAVSVLAGNTYVKPGDDFISAMTAASAGDTVFFEAGTYQVPYTEGKANTITLSMSGTAEKPTFTMPLFFNRYGCHFFIYIYGEVFYVDD